jgi:hypothetical protein
MAGEDLAPPSGSAAVDEKERAIRADVAAGLDLKNMTRRHVGTSVVQRIKAEVAAEKAPERRSPGTCSLDLRRPRDRLRCSETVSR